MRASEVFVPILALVFPRTIDVNADEQGANWKVKANIENKNNSQNFAYYNL